MTRNYLNHFIRNPHSLIVKILGVFSIKRDRQKPVFFFIMQSVFYPDSLVSVRSVNIRISDRSNQQVYDIPDMISRGV